MTGRHDLWVLDNTDAVRQRISGKVVQSPGGCHEWTGATNGKRHPYGRLNIGGTSPRFVRAHRVVWLLVYGEIPDGLYVLHRCDNSLCVNPEHLFLGTHNDNMRDRTERGRGNPITGEKWHDAHDGKHPAGDDHYLRHHPELAPHGESSALSKLTESDILAIREEWKSVDRKYGLRRKLAEKYGVHGDTITLIVKRKTWRYV